jgi:hypothetical protein
MRYRSATKVVLGYGADKPQRWPLIVLGRCISLHASVGGGKGLPRMGKRLSQLRLGMSNGPVRH